MYHRPCSVLYLRCTDTGGQIRINKYELRTDRLEPVLALTSTHASPPYRCEPQTVMTLSTNQQYVNG